MLIRFRESAFANPDYLFVRKRIRKHIFYGIGRRGRGRATSSYLKRLYVAADPAAGATGDDDIEGGRYLNSD